MANIKIFARSKNQNIIRGIFHGAKSKSVIAILLMAGFSSSTYAEWQSISITQENLDGNIVNCNASTLSITNKGATIVCYYKRSYSTQDELYFQAEFRFSPYLYRERQMKSEAGRIYLTLDSVTWSDNEFASGESSKILAAIMSRATVNDFVNNQEGNCETKKQYKNDGTWDTLGISSIGDPSYLKFRELPSGNDATVWTILNTPLSSYKSTLRTDNKGVQIFYTMGIGYSSKQRTLRAKRYAITCDDSRYQLGNETWEDVIPETIGELIWEKLYQKENDRIRNTAKAKISRKRK